MANKQSIAQAAEERILILDGAMGTMVQRCGFGETDFRGREFASWEVGVAGNNDLLNITHPDAILDIHRKYLAAGADIIETNTFSSQRVSQADYGMENHAARMALCGARLARQAADEFSTPGRPRFVCGSIGPTNKTLSVSPSVSDPAARDISYCELKAAYVEQTAALIEGGVDAILIETIFDTLNAKAAIDAAMTAMEKAGVEIPIMLSITIGDMSGRMLSGQTIEGFLASVESYPILSVGLNCSFGAREMEPFLKELSRKAPYLVSAYPNAGLPNALGMYDETAETMSPLIGRFIDSGLVNIVGGCCGTDESFIARYAEMAKGKKPRKPRPITDETTLSGLEPLHINADTGFVNVGERCNVAGSRKFLRLIEGGNYEEALSIAKKQVDGGAMVLDVNMDDGLLDAKKEMSHFLRLASSDPDVAKVPIMIDSSKWDVIEEGLKCCQGKCIVNSISLKEGEEAFLNHAKAAMRYGAAVVVMCFDEDGQATTFERRVAIAERAYRLLTGKAGMRPSDIIFDPNVLAIATGIEEHDTYARDFIAATKWIRENLPGAHVSGGVSNLSFSFRGNNYIREAMHAVFLYHAVDAGMDFGIVNPTAKVAYSDIPGEHLSIIEDVMLCRRKGAVEELMALAETTKVGMAGGKSGKDAEAEQWRGLDIESRLAYSLRKGVGDYLEEDLSEALGKYPTAVSVIEGPLMAGMDKIGELFGSGKMFLPQVVKSARTMKQAVAILQPHIEAQGSGEARKAGRVVMATVKGDVHDIGKNIAAVVMACNNYEVVDLGVMVPAEKIVAAAIGQKADAVILSGLITPSLDEMVNTAVEMEKAGLDIPLMIAGATTSVKHCALKIAPAYSGTVVWLKDASQDPVAMAKLMDKDKADDYKREINGKYEEIRGSNSVDKRKLLSIGEARMHRPDFFG